MNFKGKVAIVTGGVRGIGKAIATALLNRGTKLVVCDVNEKNGKLFLEEVKDALKPNVIYQNCDVSSYDDFKAVFEKAKSKFGTIDILINNAGIFDEDNWKRTIEVNLIGVVHGIKLALEYMGTNNGGSGGFVVNTASNAGLEGFDLGPIYSATKHAVVGLTRSYGTRYYYDKTGVKVSAICPGATDTYLYRTLPDKCGDEITAKELQQIMHPARPDEIAEAVIQLLNEGNNGALLEINNEGLSRPQ